MTQNDTDSSRFLGFLRIRVLSKIFYQGNLLIKLQETNLYLIVLVSSDKHFNVMYSQLR